MKTRAPEFRALIIILRSTGPGDLDATVLEVCGGAATYQSPARTAAVSGRKSGNSPASRRAWRAATGREQLAPGRAETAFELDENATASSVRTRAGVGGG